MIPRCVPYEKNPPRRDNILTVAMPGITSSRVQISRYTGPEDGVYVLQNWADGFKPLVEEDGDRNVNTHRSFFAIVKHAIWLMFHLRDDEREEKEMQAHGKSGSDVSSNATAMVLGANGAWECAPHAIRRQRTLGPYYSPSASPMILSASTRTSSLLWSRCTSEPALDDFPFPSPLPTPPVLCYAHCRISCRLLHNVLPSPETTEMRHTRWWCTLNPIHWMLVLKEISTCLWFGVRPIQLCYSEVGRTNLAGATDQLMFAREIQRAVELIQSREKRGNASVLHAQRPLASRCESTDGSKVDAGEEAQKERGRGDCHDLCVPRPRVRPYLVLFGCSRGAATCFYTAMKIPRCLARYVSLVIVEAPFNSLRGVIDSSSFFPNLNLWLFKAFCDYGDIEEEREAYTYHPENVQIRCPIAFVISRKDRRVPPLVTQALIDDVRAKLVPQTIPAVEVLVLAHSRHPCMAVGHKDDQAAYVEFVEGLYDKYCSGEPPPLAQHESQA